MADSYKAYVDSNNAVAKKFYGNLTTNIRIEKNLEDIVYDKSWLEFIEKKVPYLNKIYENPKKFIKTEEEILKIEKTKKVTLDSIKHLSKHTNFINTYDPEKNEIIPSKLLNSMKEETYNTYENRFAFTLVDLLEDTIKRVEEAVYNTESRKENNFLCNAETMIDDEMLNFVFKVESNKTKTNNKSGNDIRPRLETIKGNVANWKQSALYTSLTRERASKVTNPLNKTNVILKNPNFQQAAELWEFLHTFHINDSAIRENTPNAISSLSADLQRLVDTSLMFCYLAMNMTSADNTQLSNKDYNDLIKEATENVLKDSIHLLEAENENVEGSSSKEKGGEDEDNGAKTLSDNDEDGLNVENQIKGVDVNQVSKKIKENINKYLDKIDEFCFEIKTTI